MVNIKKIVFISNFFNHHQKFLSDELYRQLNGEYLFVETAEMPQERRKLGYAQYNEKYVKKYNADPKNIQKQIDEADCVIIGSAPEKLLLKRKRQKKLIFRYSERALRKGLEIHKYFARLIKWNIKNPIGCPIYLLCSSAYASADYAKFGLFKNKAYKWAYFTEVKKYQNIDELILKKKKNSILWVARMIPLKHPENALKVAKRLKDEGYEFEMNFVGDGPLMPKMMEAICRLDLQENINLMGSIPSDNVREQMEQAEIFLFNSDKKEGWGAVVNEAMNSACAVVSSHAAGVTPFLIKDGKNGYVYKCDDFEELYLKVKYLLDNPKERVVMSKNAYETMLNEWNAENAAKKFIQLASAILNGDRYPDLFKDGVCSKAKKIKDSWYR